MRGGQGRFRGLRLVHTHLRGESLTRDDFTDLALLRLDAVAAITVDASGNPGKLFIGHLVTDPSAPPDRPWRELPAEPATSPRTNFAELIAFENEEAFNRFTSNRYEATAQASAVAIKTGAAAAAKYTNGVAIFTYIKGGLMAEASVGGQRFTFQPAERR